MRIVMASFGRVVVVAQRSAAELVDSLAKAGAFPIVETRPAGAVAALNEGEVAALVLADPLRSLTKPALSRLIRTVEASRGPLIPFLVRVDEESAFEIPHAVPVHVDEGIGRLVARLQWAARIRALHARLLKILPKRQRRSPVSAPVQPAEATLLYLARTRSHCDLADAFGENIVLVEALSIETAAQHLNAREIDGVVIDGRIGRNPANAFLAALADDWRFRRLPVGLLGNCAVDVELLPNLIQIEKSPAALSRLLLPLVHLQAFEHQIKRAIRSLESEGALDPCTGLTVRDAFWRELDCSVSKAEVTGEALCIARFSFGDLDPRTGVDAARLLSRLLRETDFASQESDGSILAAFTETNLQSAHVIARRLASTLRHMVLARDHDARAAKPTVTLATLRSSDDTSTLAARVGAASKLARGAA
jgi:hypothetical protein